MKFNYKKIATVIGSALMVGSTMGMAAAANYPAPFVSSGAGDFAVVVGSTATLDITAATTIADDLKSEVTTTSTSGSEIVGGDSKMLARSTDKFNLGDQLDDFYSSLDEEELSTVLAMGSYRDDDNNDFDFEQKIELANPTLSFFHDIDYNDDEPAIGFDLADGAYILNYTLEFTDDVTNYTKMENTDLTMLGKNFYISDVTTTANGITMTLLDTANTFVLSEDESKTITVGENTYNVKLDFINTDEVKFDVDGSVTNSLNEGETYKLDDGVTYIGVKDITVQDYAGGVKKVEFSVGMGKLVLENGQEIELNDEPISNLEDDNGYTSEIKGYVKNSSAKVQEIVLSWYLDDDAWLTKDSSLVMPGLNAVQLSMGDFIAPMSEVTTVEDSSGALKVSTEITSGDVELYLLYANDTSTGFGGLGEKTNHRLVTSPTLESGTTALTLNETQKSYFVATWISGDDSESYVLELKNINKDAATGKNETEIKDVAAGTIATLEENGETEDFGNVRITQLSANDDTKMVVLNVSAAGSSGTVYLDRLVTKEGLRMKLPVSNSTDTADGMINMTVNPTTWTMNVTEETKDGNIQDGTSFQVTVGLDATDEGTQVTDTSLTEIETEDGSDKYQSYVVSDLATKVLLDKSGDLNSLTITYAGEQSYGEVYVSEVGTTVISGSTGVMTFKDSEVSSFSGKNLVVVGGSCINTVAAKLLGSETPVCGDAFTALTNVAAGQFIVKTVDNPYTAGKVAMLVAGYEAADTAKAATYVTTSTVDTTVGKSEVKTTSTIAGLA